MNNKINQIFYKNKTIKKNNNFKYKIRKIKILLFNYKIK